MRRAAELGLSALALTDVNGLYGVVRAHAEARQVGLPLVVGAELEVDGLVAGRSARLAPARPGPGGLRRPVPAGHPCALRRRRSGGRRGARRRTSWYRSRPWRRMRGGSSRSTPGPTATPRPGSARPSGARLALAVSRHHAAGEEARVLAARARGAAAGDPGGGHERRAHPRPRTPGAPGRRSPASGSAPRWRGQGGGSSPTPSGPSRARRRWPGCGATSRRGSRPRPRSPSPAGSGCRRSGASTRSRPCWSRRRRWRAVPR